MCQWHEQHRCLALDPCHKQNKLRGPAVPRALTGLLLHVERGWAPGSSPHTSRSHLLVEQEEVQSSVVRLRRTRRSDAQVASPILWRRRRAKLS